MLSNITKEIKCNINHIHLNESRKNKTLEKQLFEGSVSENEYDYRSNNFKNIKNTFTPLKKEVKRSQTPPHMDLEYIKLENQLKEMENQIKNMNDDYKYGKCFTSKNFGLYQLEDNDDIANKNMIYTNLFIGNPNGNKYLNEVQDQAKIKTEENKFVTNTQHINNINYSENRKRIELETINQNSNRKELNTISYIIPQNNNNSINPNLKLTPDTSHPINMINSDDKNCYSNNDFNKEKIQGIEKRLEGMETDISEMKSNFNKLYDCILKLLDFASNSSNVNIKGNYPPFQNNLNNNSNCNNPIRNDIYYNSSEAINYQNKNMEYINVNNNQNDVNASQRLNTQGSKISNNPNLIAKNEQNATTNNMNMNLNMSNSVSNSNNDMLNFILAECNKLKNRNFRDLTQDNIYNNYNHPNNNNYSSNYHNLNNYQYDAQDMNYYESPRNFRNEVMLNSNALNMPFAENPNVKKKSVNSLNIQKKTKNKMNFEKSFNNDIDEEESLPANFESSKI